MPEGFHHGLGRELRRRRDVGRLERSVAAVERLLATPGLSRARMNWLKQRQQNLEQRREALFEALLDESHFGTVLKGWRNDIRDDDFGERVDRDIPILLLPLRLQTRFVSVSNRFRPVELRIRFIPDDIAIRTHEPGLTPEEQADGEAFWQQVAEADDDEAMVIAWAALAASLGHERAVWVARETNPELQQGKASLNRSDAWSEAVSVEVMPEYLHVRGYRGGTERFRGITENPLDASLLVGFDPAGPDTGDNLEEEEAPAERAETAAEFIQGLPPEVRWLVDFEEAEARGLAIRIPLTGGQAQEGFDRILVVGVRTLAEPDEGETLLSELLENHQYTDGFSLVPQRTPTNNTEEEGLGFASDSDPRDTYELEFGPTRWEVDGEAIPIEERDGGVLARALGLPQESFERVLYVEGKDQFGAAHMACALWPATWGYYLRQILADTVPEPIISEVRGHFLQYVRGRGPIPAIRVGETPYGILPVTSLAALRNAEQGAGIEAWLPQLLGTLRNDWLQMSENTPRVTQTSDPEHTIFDILSMLPTSSSFSASSVYGEEFITYTLGFLGAALRTGSVSGTLLEEVQEAVDHELERLGFPGVHPRIRSFTMGDPVPISEPYLVAPVVEPAPMTDDENYIRWLAEAPSSGIQSEQGLPSGARDALLYKLLRHSLLTSQVEAARFIWYEIVQPELAHLRFEPEIVDIPGFEIPPPLHLLDEKIPIKDPTPELTGITTGDYLYAIGHPETAMRAVVRIGDQELRPESPLLVDIGELTASLQALANMNKDQLQLLLTETLDLCSHRLDAWITSLATKRLWEIREEVPRGIYLGAFGWVEDLQMSAEPTHDGGFILTPTLDHANAAAVLRDGFITNREVSGGGELAVDLSSERVKTALWLFDGLRAGHKIGTLLGYRFERALHERSGEINLDQYIAGFRDEFPIDAGELTEYDGPVESVAANNVVDGLRLHNEWKKVEADLETFVAAWEASGRPYLFGNDRLPRTGTPDFDAVVNELKRLDDLYDAMADLSLAEAVFQSIRGDFERAAAVTDAMAGARHVPEIEIARSRRGGARIKYRVIAPISTGSSVDLTGWPGELSPRAKAGSDLNRWLAWWIGDPREIGLYVHYLELPDETAGEGEEGDTVAIPKEEAVTFAQLGIHAIDALEFAQSASEVQRSELELRVERFVMRAGANRTEVRIAFDDLPPWDRPPERAARPARMFSEVRPLLEALRRAVSRARAVLPSDLAQPEESEENPLVGVDFADLNGRAANALRDLWEAYEDFAVALSPFDPEGAAPPTAAELEAIQDACAVLGAFGVTGALIPSVIPEELGEEDQADAGAVLARERSVRDEVAGRLRRLLRLSNDDDLTEDLIDELIDELDLQLADLDSPVTDAAANLPPEDLNDQQLRVEALKRYEKHRSLLRRLEGILRGVFGRSFPVTLRFDVSGGHPLRPSYEADMHAAEGDALPTWFHRMGEIHPGVGDFGLAALLSEVQGTGAELHLRVAQTPFANGDIWVGQVDDGREIAPDTLSIVFTDEMTFADDAKFSGLVLGAWEEAIANATETGGLTFHFDQPSSEPPQTLLLAVAPPAPGQQGHWDADLLFDILGETLDLARIRTIDPDLMETYGALIPAIYLTHNTGNQAVSTPILYMTVAEQGSADSGGNG